MLGVFSPVESLYLFCINSLCRLASALGLYKDQRAIERAERLRNAAPDSYIRYIESRRPDVERRLARCDCPKVSSEQIRVIGWLGEGAFGKVVVARLGDDERDYAIKIQLKEHIDRRCGRLYYLVRERNIQWAMGSAFVLELKFVSQDDRNVYMVLEYSSYGDLSMCTIENPSWTPTESGVKIYAAQIVLGLEYLHEFEVVLRDLKPGNCIVFPNGYLKLTDFGLSRTLRGYAFTFCGSEPYMAPEMEGWSGYTFAVDWYALGVTVYQLLHKRLPFNHFDEDFRKKKVNARFNFSDSPEFSQDVRRFVIGLMQPRPKMRLGNLAGKIEDVKKHPWFSDIDFDTVFNQLYEIEIPCGPLVPDAITEEEVFDRAPSRTSLPLISYPGF